MSTSVDNRVVQMQFDNAQFEAGISQSLHTLERLDKALDSLESSGGFSGLSQSISDIGNNLDYAFSFKGVAALTTFKNVATDLYNFFKGTFSSLVSDYIPLDMISQMISGGRNRAQNIEQAKFQLKGLKVAWEEVSEDINYAVDKTAYGLDAAAKAASQLVASGVRYGATFGDTGNSPMAKALRGISGLAAMTNSTYEDISQLFTTIAGKGRMQAEELNRFAYRGVNMAATLATEFNTINGYIEDLDGHTEKYSEDTLESIKKLTKGYAVTEADIRDFASKNSISFAMFSEAANAAFGEHATAANETYAGSLSNVRAALSRIGADFYQKHLENMTGVFNSLRLAINNFRKSLQPAIGEINKLDKSITTWMKNVYDSQSFKSVLDSVAKIAAGILGVFNRITQAINQVFKSDIAQTLVGSVTERLADFADKISKLQLSSKTLVSLYRIMKGILSVFMILGDAISSVFYILEPWLNVLNGLAGAILWSFSEIAKGITNINKNISENEGLKVFVELARYFSEEIAEKFTNALIHIIAYLWTFWDILLKSVDIVKEFVSALGIDLNKTAQNLKNIFNAVGNTIATVLVGALIGLVAVIAQVVVWGYKLYNAFKAFSWEEFREGINASVKELSKFIDGLISKAPEALQGFLKSVKKFGGRIISGILTLFDGVIEEIDAFRHAFEEGGIEGVLDRLRIHVQLIAHDIKTAFEFAFNFAVTIVSEAYTKITGYIDKIKAAFSEGGLGGVYKLFENKLVEIGGVLSGLFDTLAPVALDAISTAFSTAWEAVSGFFDSIADTRLGGIVTSVVGLFSSIGTAVTSLFDKFSKLDIVQKASKPFSDFFNEVSASFASEGLSGVLDTIRKKFEGFSASIQDFFTNNPIVVKIKGIASQLLELAKVIGGLAGAFLNGPLQTGIDWLIDKIQKLTEVINALFGNISSNNPTSILSGIGGSFSQIAGIFSAGTEEVTRSMDVMATAIQGGRKKFYGEGGGNAKKGEKYGHEMVGNLKDQTEDVKAVAEEAEEAGKESESIFQKISDILSGILLRIKNAAKGISDLLADDQFGEALKSALGVTTLIAIPVVLLTVLRALDTFKKAAGKVVGGIISIGKVVTGIVGGIESFLKGTAAAFKIFAALGGLTKLVGAFALFLVAFTATMQLIGGMGDTEYERGKKVVIGALAFITAIAVLSAAFATVSAKANASFSLAEKKLSITSDKISSIGTSVRNIALAVLAIAAAFWLVSKVTFNVDDAMGPIVIIGLMMMTLVGAVAFLAKYAPQLSKGSVMILAMALSVNLLVGAFAGIAAIVLGFDIIGKGYVIEQAFIMLASLMGAMAVLALFASKLKLSSGLGLLAMVSTLLILDAAFGAIAGSANLNMATVIGHIEQFGAAIGALVVLLYITKYAGENAAKAGVYLIALAVAVRLMGETLKTISEIFANKDLGFFRGVGIIATIAVLFYGIGKALAASKDAGEHALKAMVGLSVLITAIGLMTTVLAVVAKIDQNALGAATLSIILFTGMIALLVASLAATKNAKWGPIAALAVLVGILGGIVSSLLLIGADVGKTLAITLGLTAIIGALAFLAKSFGDFTWRNFFELLEFGVLVVAIGWTLNALNGLDIVTLKSSVMGVIKIIGTLGLLAGLMSYAAAKMDDKAAKRLGAMTWAIVGICAGLLVVSHAVSMLSQGGLTRGTTDDLVPAVTSLVAIVLAMAALAKAAENVNWASVFSIVAVAGSVVLVGYVLSELRGIAWDEILPAAISIAGVVAVLAGVAFLCTQIDTNGFVKLGVIAAIVGAVAYSLFELSNHDWQPVLVAAGAISGVVLILAGVAFLCSEIDTNGFVKLGVITAVIGAVAYSLYELASYSWEQIVFAAGAIAGVVAILAGVSALSVNVLGLVSLVVIAGVVGAVAYSLYEVASYPWEQILFAAGAIAGVIAILAGLSLVATGGIIGLVGIALVIGTICAAMYLMPPAVDAMVDAVDRLIESFIKLANWFKENTFLGAIDKELTELVLGTGDENGLSGLPGKVSEIAQDIGAKFNEGWEAGKALVGDIAGWFKEHVLGSKDSRRGSSSGLYALGSEALTAARDLMSKYNSGLNDAGELSKVSTAISGLKDIIIGSENGEGGFLSFIDDAASAGKDIIGGFINGLKDPTQWGIVKGLCNLLGIGAIDAVDEGAGVNSPSWKTMLTGGYIDQGLALGLLMNAFLPQDAANQVADGTVQPFYDLTNSGIPYESGADIPRSAADGINANADAPVQATQGILSNLESLLSQASQALGIGGQEAGQQGILGLLNGFSDNSIIGRIMSVAHELGIDTVEELQQAIKDGTFETEQVCAALGIDATSALGKAIDRGMVWVKNNLSGHLSQLQSMFSGAGGSGLFNFGGIVQKAKDAYGKLKDDLSNLGSNFTGGGFGGGGSGSGGGGGGGSAKDAAEAARKHAKAVELQNKVIKEFNEVYGESLEKLGDTNVTETAKAAIHAMAEEYAKAGEDIDVTEQEIEDAFLEMYDNIKQAVEGSMDMFSRFSADTSESGQTIIRNMKSNLDATEEWANSLEKLAARGFAKGVIENLANEGTKSLGKVRSLLMMNVGEMFEVNALWDAKKEAASNAAIKALTAMAYAGRTTQKVVDVAQKAVQGSETNIKTGAKEIKKSLEQIDKSADDTKESLEELGEDTSIIDGTADMADAVKDNMGEIQAAIDKVDTEYKILRETVASTIEDQLDLFSKFDRKTETSAEEMLENMQSQISGVSDWGNAISMLKQKGIDDGLLNELVELGPKGYDTVNAFVQMTADQLAQANNYYKQSLTLPDVVAQQVSDQYLTVATNGIASMISGIQGGQGELDGAVVGAISAAAEAGAVEAGSDHTRLVGGVYAESVGLGITDNTELPKNAAEGAISDSVDAASTVAEKLAPISGQYIDQGFANGIDEYAYIAIDAAARLAQAVNSQFMRSEDMASPSKIWAGFGKYMVLGLSNSMITNTGLAVDAAEGLSGNVNDAFAEALNNFSTFFDDNVDLDPTIKPVLDLSEAEKQSSILSSMFDPKMMDVAANLNNLQPISNRMMDAMANIPQSNTTNMGGFNITINAQPGMDPNDIANAVSQEIYRALMSREAVAM